MAMQLPVITNSVGAEGIDLNNEEHLVVENDYKVIAEKVDYYLRHEEERKAIAENGRKKAKESCSFISRLEKIFNQE